MNRVLLGIAVIVAGAAGISAGCFSSSNGSGPKDGGAPDGTSSSSSGGSGSGSSSGGSSGGSSGSSSGGSSGGSSGSSSGSSGGDGGSPCVDPQLTFGNIGQGDSNVHFTSGVGARSSTELFIFSGYLGPDPTGDGGGANVELVYVQAFDPTTAVAKGPAQPLFTGPNPNPGNAGLSVDAAAVAPTGQMALVYHDSKGFSVAFLDAAADGGAAGLTVVKTLLLDSSPYGHGDPAHVIWSNTSQSFVISTLGLNGVPTIAKYTAAGAQTAGGVAAVTTDDMGQTYSDAPGEGSVGESGGLLGIVWVSNNATNPEALTVYSAIGTQVGGVEYVGGVNGPFATLAGVAGGFVTVYANQNGPTTTGLFIPTAGGAFQDGGTTFSVPGVGASKLRAISDGVGSGGAGGVGLGLLYQGGNSAGFAYIHADGTTVDGPVTVFSTGPQAQAEISLTNLNGSFVTAFNANGNQVSTQIAASGCN